MDVQRKSIQNLTDSLDATREELSLLYRSFGEKLLQDSADPTVPGGALPVDRVDTWRNLMSARELDTQAILDIKAAVARQQELQQFRRELDKSRLGIESHYTDQLRDAGKAFYETYTEDDSEFFASTYEKASVEGSAVLSLESRLESLRSELESAGFLGKMVIQFKISSTESALRQHQGKIRQILADGARDLVESGVLEKKFEAGELAEQLSSIMTSLRETTAKREEMKKREGDLESDLAQVKQTLQAFHAESNPLRRMDELHAQINDTDKRIETLAVISAREYCDKFLDEDGFSILGSRGDGNDFSDMGMYSRQLENISALRKDISRIRRQIEILESTLRMDSLDRGIQSMERTLGEYERKVAHYQELMETQRRNIQAAQEERAALEESRQIAEKGLSDIR